MSWKSVLTKIGYVLLAFCLTFVPGTIADGVHALFGTGSILSTILCNALAFLIFGAAFLFFRFKKKDEAFKLHTKFDIKKFVSLAGLFILLSILLNPIFYWISQHVSSVGIEQRAGTINSQEAIFYVVLTVLVAPICEEVMYRLFIYNLLKREFSWFVAMLVSSLFFGMAHNTGPHLVIGTVFGMFCCMCYELSGSYVVSMFAHIIYNVLTLVIPYKSMGSSTVITWIFIVITLVIFSFMMFRTERRVGTESLKKLKAQNK